MTAWMKVTVQGHSGEGAGALAFRLNEAIHEALKVSEAVEVIPLGVSQERGDYGPVSYCEALLLHGTPAVVTTGEP